jgi:phytoene desaturase
VEGLFLVGAGKHAAAGVPGVLSSARVIHSLVPNAP